MRQLSRLQLLRGTFDGTPPTIREQISKVWNLDDIDCDFPTQSKLPTEDLKCVVYRGDEKTKITLHANENKLGLYTHDGKRLPIK